MTRSNWRLPFIHPLLLSSNFLKRKSIKTSLRFITLPYLNIGNRSFYVYNGQKYIQVIYKKEMTGFKLGTFALTKTIGYQKKSKKKNKKKK